MRCQSLIVLLFVASTFAKRHREDDITKWSLRLRSLLKDCPSAPWNKQGKSDFLHSLRYCMQHRALATLDALFASDVIPIVEGINLIRFKTSVNNSAVNNTNIKNATSYGREIVDSGWREVILNRVARVFRTHVLKVNFESISNQTRFKEDLKEDVVEGRRRHHRRRHIMPLMMMGLLIMGSVLIPMGFQFLAVLGGKALLLAKMALILSSIQGLKKIATSGVNYGLYHAVPEQWHERSHSEAPILYEPPYEYYHHHHHHP